MTYRINVLFEKDEHGYFAYCPQLKGCHSQGETFEKASGNIREAVELYLETMTAGEGFFPTRQLFRNETRLSLR